MHASASKDRRTSPVPGQRLVRLPVAAQLLDVSLSTVYKLVENEELLSVKIGRAHRIPVAEIDRYIQNLNATAS